TPDDRLAVVVDGHLPRLAELIAGVFDHVVPAGVRPEDVTLVCAPPGGRQGWVDDLPDEYADSRVEIHDPADRNRLSYLATTKGGRRLYLNRSLVDADQAIILCGREYDPLLGLTGPASAVYPALADAEARAGARDRLLAGTPGEAEEVAWLLGTPFVVQA